MNSWKRVSNVVIEMQSLFGLPGIQKKESHCQCLIGYICYNCQMKIIFVSNLSNNIDAGLNYSVPAGVKAQQEYDEVLWIDLTKNAFQKHWGEVEAYHNISQYANKLKLSNLPASFSNPDIVVFEGFYYVRHVLFALSLIKKHIPYIIVPRGSMTKEALFSGNWMKRLKKKAAYLLIFDFFINHAAAIQYLTHGEKQRSVNYHVPFFILPNGIEVPQSNKKTFSQQINAVFIGRLDIYTKGLDLLLEALAMLKEELPKNGFRLDIYGAPRYDCEQLSYIVHRLGLEKFVFNHGKAVFGVEKEEILLNSDLFILTSRTEGHPMGLIEALAYGLPVLVTPGTNMAQEIQEADAGWITQCDIVGIQKALQIIIQERALLSRKGQNAMILANRYRWDMIAMEFHKQVELLLKS